MEPLMAGWKAWKDGQKRHDPIGFPNPFGMVDSEIKFIEANLKWGHLLQGLFVNIFLK